MGEEDIIEEEPEEETLNAKQEFFCELFATHREFYGNGVQAYLEAYDPPRRGNWYNAACASASRLLSNVKVIKRVNELLEEGGFTDIAIDKQLAFLITQHADFKTKLGAIKEYNALRARITKKLDMTSMGEKLPTVDLDALATAMADRLKEEKI